MAEEHRYQSDIDEILSHRFDNGMDYWTAPDGNMLKGSPFGPFESVLYLVELGLDKNDTVIRETAEIIFSKWQKDGRFKLSPKSAIYPCNTITAVQTLCALGYVDDSRVQHTLDYLLKTQYKDGGWRCNKFSFGRGPETEFSNPHPTLMALNAFRHTGLLNKEPALDRAVEFLLMHWEIRKPIGPCHYGIGTLFMQTEYPLRSYNIFYYVYVLSFYNRAKKDSRFLEAFSVLQENLEDGKIVPRRMVKKLAGLNFCKKNEPSVFATKRYQEILMNLAKNE